MNDPYRHQEPTPERTPRRFSPLRPLRRLTWYMLIGLAGVEESGMEALVAFFGIGVPIIVWAASRQDHPTVAWYALLIAGGALSALVMRRWLKSAMHLDNEESKQWWERFLE